MSGDTAIVTGYSSGLGEAIAARLLESGWNVVGVSRKSEPDKLIARYGEKLVSVHGSVDADSTAEAAFKAAQELGELKIVVNCAGQGVFGDVGSYNSEDIYKALQGNLVGLILFSDHAVRAMGDTGGAIVNVMSTASKKLRPAESVYCSAKWGAKAYTRTLRDALKAKKSAIRVYEVYPCGMNTAFWSEAVRPVAEGSAFPPPEPIAEMIVSEILDRRAVYTQEITFERS